MLLWGTRDRAPDWCAQNAEERASHQSWADHYDVDTSNLILVDGKCTRYGLVTLGDHRFIVGPTASPVEAGTLTRLLSANRQIGAVFCVEPGVMRDPGRSEGSATRSGYRQRPIGDYIQRISRGQPAEGGDPGQSSRRGGGLSHVQFSEFEGMEAPDVTITGTSLWTAGHGVADFMRRHPGKLVIICSENGIARPCAVIASAALQLAGGDVKLREDVSGAVARQRSHVSNCYVDVGARNVDLVAELATFAGMLRAPIGDKRALRGQVQALLDQLRELKVMVARDAGAILKSDALCRKMASALEENFAFVAPLLTSDALPSGTALLRLRDSEHVVGRMTFLADDYVHGHTDRISLEPIEPSDPNAVRLVTPDDNGLVSDNKYYDMASVADWYRQCMDRDGMMSHPITRQEVVALLVPASQRKRLASTIHRSPE